MPCPNCSHEETAINEIDESLCCANCGTVLERDNLRNEIDDSHEGHFVPVTSTLVSNKACIYWYIRVCSYFDVSQNYINAGKTKLMEKDLSKYRKFPKEVAMGTFILVAKDLKPAWTFDDYLASFPLPLYKPVVIKTFTALGGKSFEESSNKEAQIDYTIKLIYKDITKQLFVKKPPTELFNLNLLKYYTSRLLKLGGNYGLNSGKKIRVMIIVTALLSSLYLRTKIPLQYILEKNKMKRRNVDYYSHFWILKSISIKSFSGENYIRKLYNSYSRLCIAAVKKFKWLPQTHNDKQFFYHLDDILNLYLNNNNEDEAHLKLDKSLFYPEVYVRNSLKYQNRIKSLIRAVYYIRNEKELDSLEKESITYHYYRLLKEGYSEKELEVMDIPQVKHLSCILDYRVKFNNIQQYNDDLDRELIEEDDMCDEEVELYIN